MRVPLYSVKPNEERFTAAIHIKRFRPLYIGRTAVVVDFPRHMGVPHRAH